MQKMLTNRLGQDSIHRRGQNHTDTTNTGVRKNPVSRGGPPGSLNLSRLSGIPKFGNSIC
jgi:hypothetical protein